MYDLEKIREKYPSILDGYEFKKSVPNYIKKGALYRYKAHVIYYTLRTVRSECAKSMLEETRALPDDREKILKKFLENGYNVKHLSVVTGENRAVFYKDTKNVVLFLRDLYACLVAGEKAVARCFENENVDKCPPPCTVEVEKILF